MNSLQTSPMNLPPQDLERCSLFPSELPAATEWADQLPLGSPQRAGESLRTALGELNRVPLPPLLRFQLFEALRAPVLSVTRALTQECLNQPIVLDENTQRQSDLIEALHRLGTTACILVAVDTIRDSEVVTDINPARLACEALHRAVVHCGLQIQHAYLLYQPVEPGNWARLHQLYALAERQQLARLPVDDSLRAMRSSVAEEYLAPLMLACSRPNQLRQHDISGAYRAFQEWREFVRLQDPELGHGLFAVDMDSDRPPAFADLLKRRGHTHFRYINAEALVSHLERLKHDRGTQGLRVIEFDRETRLDTNLLEHLLKALGEVSQRNFTRQESHVALDIATGMSSVHYFVAGELGLEQVIHGADYEPRPGEERLNPFLAPAHRADRWQRANPEEDFEVREAGPEQELAIDAQRLEHSGELQDEQAREPVRHLVFSVSTTNTSPGGYCIEWEEPPASVHIGDLVCLRESERPGGDWIIAVIRWISQVKHAPTLMGLELLSPRGRACAAQVKMADGELSRPIRVLVLPEIPLVGQNHTLLVPRMVFREGQRIILSRESDISQVKLKRQVASTGYFSQMDFDYLRNLSEGGEPRDQLPRGFDSIWSEI